MSLFLTTEFTAQPRLLLGDSGIAKNNDFLATLNRIKNWTDTENVSLENRFR